MKYKTKPVEIEAQQFTQEEKDRVYSWILSQYQAVYPSFDKEGKPILKIQTLEGEMTANLNDYIIKGLKGEFYPCKSDIFEMKYEALTPITNEDNLK